MKKNIEKEVTYLEVENHWKKINNRVRNFLSEINDYCIEGRNEKNVPIYATKYRVKSKESIFIKASTGKKRLDDIKDYGGLRIFCLFENDIFEVHKFILETLPQNEITIDEIEIYRAWGDQHFKNLKNNALSYKEMQKGPHLNHMKFKEFTSFLKFKDEDIKPSNKKSGYKSIHYIVSGKSGDCVEIQLRTLLQDVWAEAEHHLAYKSGNIHPHIKESFRLLAEELGTGDKRLNHLKEISKKENNSELFSRELVNPYHYFWYEDDNLPKLFEEAAFNRYKNHVQGGCPNYSNKEWIKKARELCSKLATIADPQGKHWTNMEDAYLTFCDRKLEKALELYEQREKDIDESKSLRENERLNPSYNLHFRKGEIYFIQGKIEKALIEFHKCEFIIDDPSQKCRVDNKYKITKRLAHIYWLLGGRFYDMALNHIENANEAFNELKRNKKLSIKINETDQYTLTNDLCLYNLEKYVYLLEKVSEDDNKTKVADIKRKANKYYKIANKYYKKLKVYLDKEKSNINVSSNFYDTAAWFCYQTYKNEKVEKPEDFLKTAVEHCEKILTRRNKAPYILISINIHRNHYQQIIMESSRQK